MNGEKEIVINPNERAVSTDVMRLQTFKATDTNELLRQMFDTFAGQEDSVALSIQHAATGTPASACIPGPGLLVTPQNATLNLTVSPGVIGILDPDAVPNPDESPYKFVNDPGVQTLGALVMSANASGSTRIDVIECARVAAPGYVVLETDSRDVFNSVSGTFSAATVNKVTATRLQYRVRLGTPGAGFPGAAAGWVPLAVASVPNGTVNNDTIVFWDVRPLAQDRVRAPFNYPTGTPSATRRNRVNIDNAGGAAAWLQGGADVDASGNSSLGYRLGGSFAAVAAANGIDLSQAANQSGAIANSALAFVYLLAPFGLPRWATYTPASLGVRVPSMRGIPVLSSQGTDMGVSGGFNAPDVALALPSGLGGTTQQATCIAATTVTGGGVIEPLASDGTTQYPSGGYGVATGTIGGTVVGYVLTPNGGLAAGGYPACARALDVLIALTVSVPNTTTALYANPALLLETSGGQIFTSIQLQSTSFRNDSGGALAWVYTFRAKIPVPWNAPAGATWKLVLDTNLTAGTITGSSATIIGAEI